MPFNNQKEWQKNEGHTGQYRTAVEIRTCAQDADLICFDVFDTLITRRVLHPVDVFRLVEEMMPDRLSLCFDFQEQRIHAEQTAYAKSRNGQATLKEIYTILAGNLGLTPEQEAELMNLELEAEQLLVIPRTDVRELVLELRRNGKQLLLVSDMYLPSERLRQLLKTCDYPEDLPILVSCEEGKSKGDGSLWKAIVQSYTGKRIMHIGDNLHSDYQNAVVAGVKAFLIPNPCEQYAKGKVSSCLNSYDNGSFGNALLLGTLVNDILYNHAFDAQFDTNRLTQLWLGPVFAKFSRWLAHNDDDCLLLFVTRENYILRPMYLEYCRAAGINPRPSCNFFASRQATAAAAFKNEESFKLLFQETYDGSFENFVRTHCNFDLPENDVHREDRIVLPAMSKCVEEYLRPYSQQIQAYAATAAELYRRYTERIRSKHPDKQLSIVDVGYRGTAQYYLSLALDEKLSGEYLLLNNRTMPQLLSCPERCVARVTNGRHPLYDNLLFLEGAMQVSYGQLKCLEMDEQGDVIPVCNSPHAIAPELEAIQNGFLDYVREEAVWDKRTNGRFDYDLILAEDIFAALIACDLLPDSALLALQIDDAFSGHISWHYNKDSGKWESALTSIPFVYTEPGYRLPMKRWVKNMVKKSVPRCLYEPFRLFWVRFLK